MTIKTFVFQLKIDNNTAHLRVFYDQPKTGISGPSQLKNTKTGTSTRTTHNQVKTHSTSHVICQKHIPVYLYELLGRRYAYAQ